jgi:hypothetical protein
MTCHSSAVFRSTFKTVRTLFTVFGAFCPSRRFNSCTSSLLIALSFGSPRKGSKWLVSTVSFAAFWRFARAYRSMKRGANSLNVGTSFSGTGAGSGAGVGSGTDTSLRRSSRSRRSPHSLAVVPAG